MTELPAVGLSWSDSQFSSASRQAAALPSRTFWKKKKYTQPPIK